MQHGSCRSSRRSPRQAGRHRSSFLSPRPGRPRQAEAALGAAEIRLVQRTSSAAREERTAAQLWCDSFVEGPQSCSTRGRARWGGAQCAGGSTDLNKLLKHTGSGPFEIHRISACEAEGLRTAHRKHQSCLCFDTHSSSHTLALTHRINNTSSMRALLRACFAIPNHRVPAFGSPLEPEQ